MIHDQGIEVVALNFHTGFCFTDARRAVRKTGEGPKQGGASDALSVAARLGVRIEVVDISQDYLAVLHHPNYGYGKNVNPCVDCRIHMFQQAREIMEAEGASFVFTGEVLGQRPKSQHLSALHLIAKQSGLTDRLLRPLSAQLLPPILPEREGIVDRSRLMGFHGRNRKPQMALAAELGIGNFPQPAGGCCFLTDPNYSRKVQDMWEHGVKDEMEWDDYLLLKVGRHVRLTPEAKVIVGRDEGENLFLDQYRSGLTRFEAEGVMGPVALLDADDQPDWLLENTARVVARYSDAKDLPEVTVRVSRDGSDRRLSVVPFTSEAVQPWVIS